MIVVCRPQQVTDMIAVRFFLFPDTKLTQRISPLALAWASNRDIPIGFRVHNGEDRHYITLPPNYEQYTDWSRVIFLGDQIQDGFHVSMDLFMEVGWHSIRRLFRPFNSDERAWLWENAPNYFAELTRRKPKS